MMIAGAGVGVGAATAAGIYTAAGLCGCHTGAMRNSDPRIINAAAAAVSAASFRVVCMAVSPISC